VGVYGHVNLAGTSSSGVHYRITLRYGLDKHTASYLIALRELKHQ